MNKFPCTSCGACCRRLNILPEEVIEKNGLSLNDKGHCTNLKEDNTCEIYEDRPEICIVDHSKWDLPKDKYYKEVASICNEWMDEDNSDYERVEL